MWCRRVAVLVACVVVSAVTAPCASAEPEPEVPASSDAAPVDDGQAPPAAPATTKTPDGCTLTVWSEDETQVPVAPLTTAMSSREYVVGGTFAGSIKCPGA
jgi:hypothetical protein